MKNKAFETNFTPGFNNGFKMTFENGCTISVQFGMGKYCDQGQTTAEVAAWNFIGDWMVWNGVSWNTLTDGTSDVMSHVRPDEVARMMSELVKQK